MIKNYLIVSSFIIVSSIVSVQLLGSAQTSAGFSQASSFRSAFVLQEDQNKREKIEAVNAQLIQLAGDHNWQARKEIVRHAVEWDGIHPDELKRYSDRVLSQAVLFNDNPFASFLLMHGANASGRGMHDPLLADAKTVAMANLLCEHGAQQVIVNNGAECLSNAVLCSRAQPALISWFIEQGVDVNGYYQGQTPLMGIVYYTGALVLDKDILERASILMRAGALLSLPYTSLQHREDRWAYGCNVPQLIQKQLDRGFCSEKTLRALRASLIQASDSIHIRTREALDAYLPSVVSSIVFDYSPLEESYEELELSSTLSKAQKAEIIKAKKQREREEQELQARKEDGRAKKEYWKNTIKITGFASLIGALGIWSYLKIK